MIKETKNITQNFDVATGRAIGSRVDFKRKFFGITIYTWTEDFEEKQLSEESAKIGFNK